MKTPRQHTRASLTLKRSIDKHKLEAGVGSTQKGLELGLENGSGAAHSVETQDSHVCNGATGKRQLLEKISRRPGSIPQGEQITGLWQLRIRDFRKDFVETSSSGLRSEYNHNCKKKTEEVGKRNETSDESKDDVKQRLIHYRGLQNYSTGQRSVHEAF